MKLKCKLCTHVVDVKDPVMSAASMTMHVQTRHSKVAMCAVQAIAAYLSTYFFDPVGEATVAHASVPTAEQFTSPMPLALLIPREQEAYKETRKTLLQGFREWAKVGIK